MAGNDYILVGSGINSLVCAALLAKAGNKVCVLERNDWLGGCIKSDEITVPGFLHDVFSQSHPLFITSPGYAELKDQLHNYGLEYVNTEMPTGVVLPDNRHFILTTSREENINRLEALENNEGLRYQLDMEAFEKTLPLTFGLLGNEPWSSSTIKLFGAELYKHGLHSLLSYFGEAMTSTRTWLKDYKSDEFQACMAPWVLHLGLGPESAMSGFMNRLVVFTVEQAGIPVVKGGSYKLVHAFKKIVEQYGGELHTGIDVERIIIRNNQAVGVNTSEKNDFMAEKAIICNVTPTQLYQRLLAGAELPENIKVQSEKYYYGRGDMQIHIAMNTPPQWVSSELGQVALLHLTPGLDAVSKAVNEAERGLLPETATIVVAQPTASDPSRAPKGKSILWVQLQELPPTIRGDAACTIKTPADGEWDESVREQYADRIIERLSKHITNLNSDMLGRTVLSPADLEANNINLVGGDPYSGSCSIDQFMLWRPLRTLKNHTTPVKNVFHIGASTHPGPGLGGNSGYMLANRLR